jgi:anthranilate synthase
MLLRRFAAPTAEFPLGSGDRLRRSVRRRPLAGVWEEAIAALDERPGFAFLCDAEQPGRYRPCGVVAVEPPLRITGRRRQLHIDVLSPRGRAWLSLLEAALLHASEIEEIERGSDTLRCRVGRGPDLFAEEERTRRPSVFSLLRRMLAHLRTPAGEPLGLWGAFGYDLVRQFEDLPAGPADNEDARDLVLYLADRLTLLDPARDLAEEVCFDLLSARGGTTTRHKSVPPPAPEQPQQQAVAAANDLPPGGYAALVRDVLPLFERGELFELVLSHSLRQPTPLRPSEIARRLREREAAPYGFLLSLGEGEHLIGASPEMFVRVRGQEVETCPISGTIGRGSDAMEDAERIRALLASAKDEAELTMCTDVDRNDKARVCEAGSIRLVARRQIEIYSRLIHTVDHVRGTLRPGCDGLDAFLSHAWAATVTGAPKPRAMAEIARRERSPRRWYGGAVGVLLADGDVETGLTLRSLRLKDGIADIRVGATLLHASEPEAEEAETLLKAAAMRAVLASPLPPASPLPATPRVPFRPRVLLVDHHDSFALMLADGFRAAGAELRSFRPAAARVKIAEEGADLVVLSPGPGLPADVAMAETIRLARASGAGLFGVCLGFQGLAEDAGARLMRLPRPAHGIASVVHVRDAGGIFAGLPQRFPAGRYHSWALDPACPPQKWRITAESEDGLAMAIEHPDRPEAAVLFHPESLLTSAGGVGTALLAAVLHRLAQPRGRSSAAAFAG